MMGLIIVAAFAAAALSNDPVISAYHDYQTAHASGDLPGAEVAAKKALAASDQPDGDVGRTTVLAFNLALIETELDHEADAIGPARRALALVKGGAKGVDPLAVRLLLGEAELSTVPSADETDLMRALHEAAKRSDLDTYAYPAAIVLGRTALNRNIYLNAQAAFEAAALHAAGAGGEIELARGRALIQESLAMVAQHNDIAADNVLLDAVKRLAPLSPEAPNDKVSFGELSFSEAETILAAERARQRSENGEARFDPIQVHRPPLKGRPPLCPGRFFANPMPKYPWDMQSQYSVGAAIMRAKVNPAGDVTDVKVLSIFPDSSFRKALEDPHIHWSFISNSPAPGGCRLDTMDAEFSVSFSLK